MSYNVFAAHRITLQRPNRAVLAAMALAALTACHPSYPPAPAASTANTATAPMAPAPMTPVAYTPPTVDALYQMVAPIALYPDKLVALVLAGAIHPDEVTSAYNWLAQNPQVVPAAVNQQPWDPSIKSLTTFPNALNLMQSNLPWTTALGQAYNNDPSDVLNAVQVMRQRAQQAGHLQSNTHLRVTQAVTTTSYMPSTAVSTVYAGPAIVAPPAQYIAIEPAQAQTVFVPSYDPGVVYGSPVAYYEGYHYRPPVVSGPSPVAIGALAFGAGIAITAALDHHDWGWHAWDVHWGDAPAQARWRHGDAPLPAIARPAVTYQQNTYVSHVNNVSNVSRNTTVITPYNTPPTTGLAAGSSAPPTTPIQSTFAHHGEAVLAGTAAAGAALGAMSLHHAPSARPKTPVTATPAHGMATASAPLPHGQPGQPARNAPTSASLVPPPPAAAPAYGSAPHPPRTMAAALAPAHPVAAPPAAVIRPPQPAAARPSAGHANLTPSLMRSTGTGLRHPGNADENLRIATPAPAPQPHPAAVLQRPVVQATPHPMPPQPAARPAPAQEHHAAANAPAPQRSHPATPPSAHGNHPGKEHR